ncbi:MAG: conjugal transfer protein TrbE [Negativicutes bacterium]|nr:conjugal transfer protein TrbE [Negativicutes bacterium]
MAKFDLQRDFWRADTYKEEKDRLMYTIPWQFITRDSLVFNKDGSLQLTFSYRPPDLESATYEELTYQTAQLNNIFRRFGNGWAVWMEAQRRKSAAYLSAAYPAPVMRLLEKGRQTYFSSGVHYENEYYFTFYYNSFTSEVENILNRMKAFFITSSTESNRKTAEKELADYFSFFSQQVETIYSLLQSVFPDCRLLSPNETLTYLHSTVSDTYHPVKMPDPPMPLDYYLYDADLSGQWNPRLGSKHLRIVSIRDYSNKTDPGMLDEINNLNFEYRYVVRLQFLDKLDARNMMKSMEQKWDQKQKTFWQMFYEEISKKETPKLDQTAIENAGLIAEGVVYLDQDEVGFGHYTLTVVVADEDEERAISKAGEVKKIINRHGFTAAVEGANSVEAWFGSLPGMFYHNVRRAMVSTVNMAHMAPGSDIWPGDTGNKHLGGPPLLYCDTENSIPFRLVLHDQDVGHAMVVGPTGAGKSVLLNTIEAYFTKYPGARLFIFDKSASSRAITAAVGGNFYNLGQEADELSFQPLAGIDREEERTWAAEWINNYLKMENYPVGPASKDLVWKALCSLAELPSEQRTLSVFSNIVQDGEIRQTLLPLTREGSFGKLFDNNQDRFGEGNWQVFEMETLMSIPSIVPPTLDYLFHRIEGQLREKPADGEPWPPAIIVLDEYWFYLKNPVFAAKIREYFKDMRKKNCGIIIATQNLSDIAVNPEFTDTILNNCPTKIFLPNLNAANETNLRLYKLFGLNDAQIKIIQEARPKHDYYFSQAGRFRKFQLALQPAELAILAATSKEDQAKITEILREFPKKEFVQHWLSYKGVQPEQMVNG